MDRTDIRKEISPVTTEAPVHKVKKGMSQPTRSVPASNTMGNGGGGATGKNHVGWGDGVTHDGKNHMGDC